MAQTEPRETFDIDSDTGTPVEDRDYKVPFKFAGRIDKLTITVEQPVLTDEAKKKLLDAERAAQHARQSGLPTRRCRGHPLMPTSAITGAPS